MKYISDRICVMYLGNMVELAESEDLFAHTYHPYTESAALRHPHHGGKQRGRERILLEATFPAR